MKLVLEKKFNRTWVSAREGNTILQMAALYDASYSVFEVLSSSGLKDGGHRNKSGKSFEDMLRPKTSHQKALFPAE